MTDQEMKRNAEGYSDPTAYGGTCGDTAHPGEIWGIQGKENGPYSLHIVLVNHGHFSTVLKMMDDSAPHFCAIEHNGRVYFTDPRKVCYIKHHKFAGYAGRANWAAFESLRQAVKKAMGFGREV